MNSRAETREEEVRMMSRMEGLSELEEDDDRAAAWDICEDDES